MHRLALTLIVLLIPLHETCAEQIYPGYDWENVSEGIYLHTRTDALAGPVDGNSVVIVSDEGVVVVDTHINPAAARAVIVKLANITDKPVTHIINSHWHDDHTNGNHAFREAFPDVAIISHAATLEALKKEWQPMEDQRKTAYAAVEAKQIFAAAETLEDPFQAIGYRTYAGYIEALKPELPTMELVYPDTVFDDRFELISGDRRIVVEWIGRGNTDGDAIIHLPDDDILITGDLVVWPIPFAFDSPITHWIDTLEKLKEFEAGTIIPEQEALFTGGDAEHVFAWRSYFSGPGLKSTWEALGYDLPAE
jgi:glyoxylase-like metal-dependent hydrolase (beta-lactamase superfamily II)